MLEMESHQPTIASRPSAQIFDFLQRDVTLGGKASAVVPPMSWSQDRREETKLAGCPDTPYVYPCNNIVTSPIDHPQRRNLQDSYTRSPSSEEDEQIDVVSDFHVIRTTEVAKDTDTSLSTQSSSPSSSPSGASQGRSPESASTPESTTSSTAGTKKKARTNYSPEQIQTLEKTFHENPYPDPDTMEQLSRDLEIPENKLKVWFQNKRARWRRRSSQPSPQTLPQYGMMPMSPIAPYSPFGFVPSSPMMASPSPHQQMLPGHFPPNPMMAMSSSHQQMMSGHFFGYSQMTGSPPLYNNCLQRQHDKQRDQENLQQQSGGQQQQSGGQQQQPGGRQQQSGGQQQQSRGQQQQSRGQQQQSGGQQQPEVQQPQSTPEQRQRRPLGEIQHQQQPYQQREQPQTKSSPPQQTSRQQASPDLQQQSPDQACPSRQLQETVHLQQQPHHMFSPIVHAPSMVSPYQPMATQFSPYMYPVTLGHYPYYC